MKKNLTAMLTAAIFASTVATSFAASNPFSDVPQGHWAYDAVSQLAQDGVIEGYGDTTFQGDKNISRYEMAQMVAKAMAKKSVPTQDKTLIDKLAAEFGDELKNLGVRVAALEKHADNVKWTGEFEYKYISNRKEEAPRSNTDQVMFRLEPQAEVNDHWSVNSRIDAYTHLNKDSGVDEDDHLSLVRIWAQGDYDNMTLKFGKFNPLDDDSLFDTEFSGGEVSFGKNVTFTIGGGRWSGAEDMADSIENAANYQYAGLDGTLSKLSTGVHYHHLKTSGADFFPYDQEDGSTKAKRDADIWMGKAAYAFDDINNLNGYYAQNTKADKYDRAWNVEYDYKGAEPENQGSWGAYLAYRYLGNWAAPASTYDVTQTGQRAWEIGTGYTIFKNTVASIGYGRGKDLADHKTVQNLFGHLEFFF